MCSDGIWVTKNPGHKKSGGPSPCGPGEPRWPAGLKKNIIFKNELYLHAGCFIKGHLGIFTDQI
jgi:hypothetical protein